jgi:hypothetical protein
MKAKGCISDVLEWRTARGFFYWRIRRRQLEDSLKDKIVAASGDTLTLKDAADKVGFGLLSSLFILRRIAVHYTHSPRSP